MFNLLSNTIAENLQHLSTHSPNYFNCDSPLPTLYWERVRMQLKKQAKAIFEIMNTLQIDAQMTLFRNNIITAIDEDNQTSTHRQLHYWQLHLPALSEMLQGRRAETRIIRCNLHAHLPEPQSSGLLYLLLQFHPERNTIVR